MGFLPKTINGNQLVGLVDATTLTGFPASQVSAPNVVPITDSDGSLNAFITSFGGDLGGGAQSAVVQGIQGVPVLSTLPTENQVPMYVNSDGAIEWVHLTTDQQGRLVIDQQGAIVVAL